MALNTLTKANTKGGAGDGQEAFAALDQSRNLLVADGGAPFTELARTGGIWNTWTAAAAPLVAFPTTVTLLEVYNNSTTAALEVLDLMAFHLLGTAALHSVALWAMVTAPKAAPSTASFVIGSQSGRGIYTSTAATRIGTGAGTTIIAAGWRPFGTPGYGVVSTATPNEAFSVPVDGKLYVPPGCSLCVTATDTLATASSIHVGASWNERVLTANSAIG